MPTGTFKVEVDVNLGGPPESPRVGGPCHAPSFPAAISQGGVDSSDLDVFLRKLGRVGARLDNPFVVDALGRVVLHGERQRR